MMNTRRTQSLMLFFFLLGSRLGTKMSSVKSVMGKATNCECFLTISFTFFSSRNDTQSSWSSSVISVPRASWCRECVSGRTVNVLPADDSHTYCSSSLCLVRTTTLSDTRYAE